MQTQKRISLYGNMVLIGLILLTGCQCNKVTPDARQGVSENKKNSKTPTVPDGQRPPGADEPMKVVMMEPPEAPGEQPKVAENDIYPGFDLSVFQPTERARFTAIAKAELCPCPDSTESLHECLQVEEKRCGLAKHLTTVVAMAIREGLNQTDVLDRVAEVMETARKTYQFDLTGSPYRGNPDAPVVIVEFADFQCPFCREASGYLHNAKEKFGGDIVLYFKHYPLSMHPQAALAANAAMAANVQGKFWPMHDLLFKYQKTLSRERIQQLLAQVGLNREKFEKDLVSAEVRRAVQRDREEAESAELVGTPAFFINGKRFLDDPTEDKLMAAIATAIAEAKSGNEKK